MKNHATATNHAQRVIRLVRHPSASEPVIHYVANSWSRCLDEYGIEPSRARHTAILEALRLRDRQQRFGKLLNIAKAEMDSLHEQISGCGFAVVLTDAQGAILHTVTHPSMSRDFRSAGLCHGALWDERHEGTNGIGTCIAEKRPVSVHHGEHFMGYNTGMCCLGAPIVDAQGELLGVLDASSAQCVENGPLHRHTLALISMSAQVISRFHFLNEFPDARILHFHDRAEFVGIRHEGLLAIDNDGSVLAANDAAMRQLAMKDRSAIVGHSIQDVFQLTLPILEERARFIPNTVWAIRDIAVEKRFYARIRPPNQTLTARKSFAQPSTQLEHRVGSDPKILNAFHSAQRFFDRGIPILLQGETGSGKEVFAKALHQRSAWADKPFVAINCGAIPEQLIESELFGYARGAFTDANRQGRPGKILQSSGGTLFLDEIGDMPLNLQTRLLRVLEQKEIDPLGSDAPSQVDLHVISASHCDIRQMCESNTFRSDLFYRLNGSMLALPPLREREDKAELIHRLLREECAELETVQVHEDAMRVLLSFRWPGNIRELRNTLRTALALCSGKVIHVADLPRELLDESTAQQPPALQAMTAAVTKQANGSLDHAERGVLLHELVRLHWNITHTAQALGISRNCLYRKLQKHGIPHNRNH